MSNVKSRLPRRASEYVRKIGFPERPPRNDKKIDIASKLYPGCFRKDEAVSNYVLIIAQMF
jgi:transposase